MNNIKEVASALLDIAKNSTTIFLEISETDKIVEIAKKFGIVLPSVDLAVFKTMYAETDRPNRNGVILPKDAVEQGLPTLIGKQINFEHEGSGRICGYIIDAELNEDKIEIVGVLFKSLFPEEMEEVKNRFKEKELAVSFEIWNKNEEGKSVVTIDDEGYKVVNPIIFHGGGLLTTSKPACPNAKVYILLAKEVLEAEQIVEKIFDENLIYAETMVEKGECKNCSPCHCQEKGGDNVEVQKEDATLTNQETTVAQPVEETQKEEIQSTEIAVEEQAATIPVTPEEPQGTPEETVSVEPASTPIENSEEVISQPVEAPKMVKRVVEEVVIFEEEFLGDVATTSNKGIRRTTVEWSDGRKDVSEEKFDNVGYYHALVANLTAKEVEIAQQKEAFEKEIASLKEGMSSKEIEIASLKEVKKAVPTLEVGAVEAAKREEYIDEVAKEVQQKSFRKR